MPVKTQTPKITSSKAGKRKTRSVLGALLLFDQSIKEKYSHLDITVIGVDEVGIGCLAGPVVAAATILPQLDSKSKLAKSLSRLNDSKKLTHEVRSELSIIIREHAHFAIASASVQEIDELNILKAGHLAMHRAVNDLVSKLLDTPQNVVILVDGNKKISQSDYDQICIIQGDSQSASIAAASVIAKVYRDQWMDELSQLHPQYHWYSNKGYGSSVHRQAIVEHGLSIWHRRTFTRNILEEISF